MGRASNVRLAVSSPHCWALASGESVARAAISRNADKMILLDSAVGEGLRIGKRRQNASSSSSAISVRSQRRPTVSGHKLAGILSWADCIVNAPAPIESVRCGCARKELARKHCLWSYWSAGGAVTVMSTVPAIGVAS